MSPEPLLGQTNERRGHHRLRARQRPRPLVSLSRGHTLLARWTYDRGPLIASLVPRHFANPQRPCWLLVLAGRVTIEQPLCDRQPPPYHCSGPSAGTSIVTSGTSIVTSSRPTAPESTLQSTADAVATAGITAVASGRADVRDARMWEQQRLLCANACLAVREPSLNERCCSPRRC